LARLAEMDVEIDEARGDDEVAAVDFLKGLAGGDSGRDAAIDEGEVAALVTIAGGVDDAAVAEEEGGHGEKFEIRNQKSEVSVETAARGSVGGCVGFKFKCKFMFKGCGAERLGAVF